MNNNIHFVNTVTGEHESCNMVQWCMMYPMSLAAQMIQALKLVNAPIAFSISVSNELKYIIADDESYNDPFTMAHEEAHIKLGHYDGNGFVDGGILNDDAAEYAADKYAAEKVGKQLAVESLNKMCNNLTNHPLLQPGELELNKLKIANRILAVQNL